MKTRIIDVNDNFRDASFHGNNAAFNCPECGALFIVNVMINKDGRECPNCGKSKAYVEGGAKSGGIARIEYDYGPKQLVNYRSELKSIYE